MKNPRLIRAGDRLSEGCAVVIEVAHDMLGIEAVVSAVEVYEAIALGGQLIGAAQDLPIEHSHGLAIGRVVETVILRGGGNAAAGAVDEDVAIGHMDTRDTFKLFQCFHIQLGTGLQNGVGIFLHQVENICLSGILTAASGQRKDQQQGKKNRNFLIEDTSFLKL